MGVIHRHFVKTDRGPNGALQPAEKVRYNTELEQAQRSLQARVEEASLQARHAALEADMNRCSDFCKKDGKLGKHISDNYISDIHISDIHISDIYIYLIYIYILYIYDIYIDMICVFERKKIWIESSISC